MRKRSWQAQPSSNKDGSVVTDNVSFTLIVFLCFNTRMTSENTAAHDLLYSHSLAWSQYNLSVEPTESTSPSQTTPKTHQHAQLPNNARSHKNRFCGLYCLYVLNLDLEPFHQLSGLSNWLLKYVQPVGRQESLSIFFWSFWNCCSNMELGVAAFRTIYCKNTK